MPTQEIRHRSTDAVLFSAELSAEYDGASASVRLGVAVKLGLKADANLTDANLTGAYLAGANLTDADLTRAYLTDANLARANLAGAYLARANLDGANLAGANLDGANLAGAYLAGAYLARANLDGANLARANLDGANLAGAYLARANLAGANFRGVAEVIDAGTPNCWRCVGWRRDGVVRVRVGCHDKTLTEGRDYWRGKDNRREVMAALDYIESVARARGWIVTDAQEVA